jgi:hypothetical protein
MMRGPKNVCLVGVLVLAIGVSHAQSIPRWPEKETTFGEILQEVQKTDNDSFTSALFRGIVSGLIVANDALGKGGEKRQFCLPSNTSYQPQTFLDVLVDYVKKYPRIGDITVEPNIVDVEASLSTILLKSLMSTFPCSATSTADKPAVKTSDTPQTKSP